MRHLAALLILVIAANAYAIEVSTRFSRRTPLGPCSDHCHTEWIQVGVGKTHWFNLLMANYDAYYGLFANGKGRQQSISLDGIVGLNWSFQPSRLYVGIGPASELFLRKMETDGYASNANRGFAWSIYSFRLETGILLFDKFMIPMGYVVEGGYDIGFGMAF